MIGVFWFSNAVRREPAIDAWLSDQTPDLGALARRWFQQMRACGRDVRELMHDGCPTACVQGAAFGYVNVFRAHANLGFFHGAELEDPAGLLEGTGKRMRHVKLKPDVALDSAALARLISAAYRDMKLRLAADIVSSGARAGGRRQRTRMKRAER